MCRRLFTAAVLAPLLVCAVVRAGDDDFNYDGFDYKGVTVSGLRDGKLLVIVNNVEKLYDLDKVLVIDLDASSKFTDAEIARINDAKKAAALYKEAIRGLNNPALKQLAEFRAIDPADTDGRWVEAVDYFLDVYKASPVDAVWQKRPTHLPAASSTLLKDSADHITAALKNFKSDEARKNLKTLQLDIYTRAGDTEAAQRLAKELSTGIVEEAGPAKPREVDPAMLANSSLAEINAAITARNYDSALKQADTLLAISSGETAIQVFQLQARIYQEEEKPDLAAAALLRIPAHYPTSAAAPAALLQAALLEKADHPDAAKALWKEIVEAYPNSKEAVIAKSQ